MCIFCAISAGEIPADVVASDDRVVIFRDISPAAPNHFVVIPRDHHDNIAGLTASDPQLAGHLLAFAAAVAQEHNPDGFRLVTNTGVDGGQSVEHVHLHILGGRHLQWPPG
jgi:histidine triad (HIT) family protein